MPRRLVSWTKLAFVLEGDGEWSGFFRERLEPSLRRQASFLAGNLEFYHRKRGPDTSSK